MVKRESKGSKPHKFSNKLLLNQWLISLFGIDPLSENRLRGGKVRPFHLLAEPIKDPGLEGLDHDNLHRFYHALINSNLFWNDVSALSKEQILIYEENIVRHTLKINDKRSRPVVWKYYQWLMLLFVEVYLDRFYGNRDNLLTALNAFVDRFNYKWPDYTNIPHYTEDDLNKLCLQSATGSGKTLLMHVNLMQYRHYSKKYGKDKNILRVILLTPNERLSEQHINEFQESGFWSASKLDTSNSQQRGFDDIDVIEITKLGDKEGPNTIATRNLGDHNLLLVDEGHRGLSGKDVKKNENAFFKNRAMLCEKGFTFEYSATFEQAVSGTNQENDYAKAILFDYSYRWFYENGFGKDYQILNLPKSFDEIQGTYLAACLLKFYQQLRIYEEKTIDYKPFNIEKPLWVFVGTTVVKKSSNREIEEPGENMISDIGLIIRFIADFLADKKWAYSCINGILTGKGQDTLLLDKDGNDIFAGAFSYLARAMNAGETVDTLYRDILSRLFRSSSGGKLILERVRGDSGEIALKVGASETCFGLINVGDAKGLTDHIEALDNPDIVVEDSDFTEAQFTSVKDSSSPVTLLIGSKKFVEGWDCWRVSTLGLMHVGRGEGAQIIQLFGRGVRLKGFEWSLKRSGHSHAPFHPDFIEEIETLNVFGIEADFMEKFREFLREEGLPGNERRKIITIPLNVTYDFGKKLKILRPKRKASDGKEYDFKKDAPVPTVGEVPKYMTDNPVLSDWYPRIQNIAAGVKAAEIGKKSKAVFREHHLSLLDYDALFFELERFKRDKGWHNLNISKEGIRNLLKDSTWYTLYLPESRLNPPDYDGVMLLQQVAAELLKRYCDHYYNYCKREYIEPRLELRELTPADDNLPQDEYYKLIVDGDEEQIIQGIHQITKELETRKNDLLKAGDLHLCNFSRHLFRPLLHVRPGGKITILPVTLNESEYQFVIDLKSWCDKHEAMLKKDSIELFLLRNMSRGKGVGFFEAGNFHPDFILWILASGKQYVTFIEPHGLLHEGPSSEKVKFHKTIKDVEKRLNDPDVILNSFILSWSRYPQLKWDKSQNELEKMHVLFMTDDRDQYINKLFTFLDKKS